MRALTDSGKVDPNLLLCYRGWDNPKNYINQKFRTTFIRPDDYYKLNNVIEYIVNYHDIEIVQFYSSEGVLNLAPRLKKIGVKTIFEVQNIDHVLYERLGNDKKQIKKIKELQEKALSICDYVLCRSEIDKQLAIELGANPKAIDIYKGGIYVEDFTFQKRIQSRFKLVFLGHLFYPPNENAVKIMVEQILPKLPSNYTITIIGIGPEDLIEKYQSDRIIFKGGVDNLSQELLSYDIAIVPLFAGSGTRLKVLDCLASGLPILSTNLGIEGLDPEIKKYIFTEDDISKYVEKIEFINNNLSEIQDMSVKGRKFVKEKYDWSNNLEPFLKAYKLLNI